MQLLKKLIRPLLIFSMGLLLLILISNIIVFGKSRKYLYEKVGDIPGCYTAIVLGAKVC
jgi:vancomycin permeability regulator SanA